MYPPICQVNFSANILCHLVVSLFPCRAQQPSTTSPWTDQESLEVLTKSPFEKAKSRSLPLAIVTIFVSFHSHTFSFIFRGLSVHNIIVYCISSFLYRFGHPIRWLLWWLTYGNGKVYTCIIITVPPTAQIRPCFPEIWFRKWTTDIDRIITEIDLPRARWLAL